MRETTIDDGPARERTWPSCSTARTSVLMTMHIVMMLLNVG